MSARLSATIDGKDFWLTAFTTLMETFLEKMQPLSNCTTDQIADALLCFQNVNLKINTQSHSPSRWGFNYNQLATVNFPEHNSHFVGLCVGNNF